MRALRPGQPYPLGANWDGAGVNFALFSRHASRVELCLFDSASARHESERIALPECTDQVWHVYVPGLSVGQLYGYRVHGPYDPKNGHRFNAAKVLLDPYAKAIGRVPRWADEVYGHRLGVPEGTLHPDHRDSAAVAPLAAVADTRFDWGDDSAPATPMHKTLIYEAHVKGFTARHPELPDSIRGTFAGLSAEPCVRHLRRLGVTAVELMPVHFHVDDHRLVRMGLVNYWGYSTLGFFAPDLRYAPRGFSDPSEPLRAFKSMVRTLHAAGIEVILDVVFNHTAESDHTGPMFSFRGLDNAVYYRLRPEDRSRYLDWTGCGNTVNVRDPQVLQLIMDSLRYWAGECRVDGFRFDLAAALARGEQEVDMTSAFMQTVRQDPQLRRLKLIAEPWDLAEGGYQIGRFPPGWTEWNGKFRDTVRSFWRGDRVLPTELATRLCGSGDLYGSSASTSSIGPIGNRSGRGPTAGVNFVTCHDGFSLVDLVSYAHKHNHANGENNKDGTDDNRSQNFGVEGPSNDPHIRTARDRARRNLLTTLAISHGVPMLNSGDELSHTRRGNNNPYCHDSDINWLDWQLDPPKQAMLDFACRLFAEIRRRPVFQRRQFVKGGAERDLVWLTPDGSEMGDHRWHDEEVRCLGYLLIGDRISERTADGQPITGNTILVLINGHDRPVWFTLPSNRRGELWSRLLDTAEPNVHGDVFAGNNQFRLMDRSIALFEAVAEPSRS